MLQIFCGVKHCCRQCTMIGKEMLTYIYYSDIIFSWNQQAWTRFFVQCGYLPPRNPPILDIIQDNWNILECSTTPKCHSDKSIKLGFRRNPHLRDMLVNSRLSYPPKPQTHGVRPQTQTNSAPMQNATIVPYWTKAIASVPLQTTNTLCPPRYLIYSLSCTRCHVKYVGETYHSLKEDLVNISVTFVMNATPSMRHLLSYRKVLPLWPDALAGINILEMIWRYRS